MKSLILFLISTLSLYSLELFVNSGVEKDERFSIVHIIDDREFSCQENLDEYSNISEVICRFDKKPEIDTFSSSKSQFFKISKSYFGGQFSIKIEPLKKAKLYQSNFDLKEIDGVFYKERESSRHWFIIGYEREIPFIKDSKFRGLNFPVPIISVKKPHIGGLDIAKKPIFFDKNIDVSYYLDLKHSMDNKYYGRVLDIVDDALRVVPDSIFKSDFILYKLRALYKLQESEEDLIEIGKLWVKHYPSNEAVAEILLYIAKSYSNIGIHPEAQYYYDRVLIEYPESKYAKYALIYLGDEKFSRGEQRAFELYEEALYSTKDKNVASLAAQRLADAYLEAGQDKEAAKLYQKIIDGNIDYLLKSEEEAYALATELADEKNLFNISYQIGEALFEKIGDNKMHDLYEVLLKNIGYWADKSKKIDKSMHYYKLYLEKFPFGDYIDFVKLRMDNLFFDLKGYSNFDKLAKYDDLIEKYGEQEIAKRAIYEKAKLLLEMGDYKETLKLEDDLKYITKDIAPEKDRVILEAVELHTIDRLESKKCQEVKNLVDEYNVSLAQKYEKPLADCYIELGVYDRVLELSSKNLNEPDLREKLGWMVLNMKALVEDRDYYRAIDLGDDIISLAKDLRENEIEYEALFEMFKAHKLLNNSEKLLEVVDRVESKFPDRFQNIQIYRDLIEQASKVGDDLMIISYAKKVIDLQNRYNSYIESPKIDLLYIQSLINLNRFKNAIEHSKEIGNLEDISKKDRVRLKYLVATSYEKSGDRESAKVNYQECKEIDVESAWRKLCSDALKILEY